MTPEERAAALARCQAATEGPWRCAMGSGGHVMTCVVRERATPEAPDTPTVFIADCLPDTDLALGQAELDWRPNMNFIRHARTDLPAALAGWDAADEEIAQLRALLGECKAQLLGLEFSGYDFDDGSVCPECERGAFHAEGCEYAALLAKVGEVTP